MKEKNLPTEEPESAAVTGAEDRPAHCPPPAEQPGAAVQTDLAEALHRELAETRDKLLRAQAEIANVSRRLRQQHYEDLKYAPMALARSVLPVIDGMEQMLQTAGDDPLAQGVRLLLEQLLKALAEHGLEPIQARGQHFNPTEHEALMQDRDADAPPGTVTQELQRGYKMHGRVLRPARVAVTPEPDAASEDPIA
jgi:molecular chaperone GrpE